MRELLFRGFHPCDGPDTIVVDGEKVKGRWVEGYYVERDNKSWIYPASNQIISKSLARELRPFHSAKSTQKIMKEVFPVLPSTVGQYTNIDVRREAWPQSEKHKIFTGDMLGEWGEDENGSECVCILGVVTYWEREGRYVLADENGLCNDWTLEDEAQPENWPHLIYCGTVFDEEAQHDN